MLMGIPSLSFSLSLLSMLMYRVYIRHSSNTKNGYVTTEISRPNELTLYEFRALRLIIRSARVWYLWGNTEETKYFITMLITMDGILPMLVLRACVCVCVFMLIHIDIDIHYNIICKSIAYLHRCMEKC